MPSRLLGAACPEMSQLMHRVEVHIAYLAKNDRNLRPCRDMFTRQPLG